MRFKVLLLTAIFTPALAHAAGCARPDKPRFPDPRTVAPENAQKLDQSMQRYAAGINAYVQCLSKEAEDAQREGSKTITYYNDDFLAEYNKRAKQ